MLTSITILPQDIHKAQEAKKVPNYHIFSQCVVAQAIHRITGDNQFSTNYTEAWRWGAIHTYSIFRIPPDLTKLMMDFDYDRLKDTSPFLQTWNSIKTN